MQKGAPKNRLLVYRAIDWFLRSSLRVLPVAIWTERCALWWGYRFQPAAGVAKLRSGASIRITEIDHLQLLIYYLGTFEPHCLPFLRGCSRKGGVILDVGANIGFYTIESSLAVGSKGRVISIEAAPRHLEALRSNIELNGMENVTVIPLAVGDAPGSATLSLPRGDNLGMFTLGEVGSDEAYSVEVDTIDSLLEKQDITSLDLVKMDIEGSEFRALRGARATFERFRPSLLIELNDPALRRCGTSSQAVRELLDGMGYEGWRIGRTSIERLDSVRALSGCDECLFVHRENRPLVAQLGLAP